MKKVLIVHDISCFGTASTTVALPLLSAMELKGVLLPTALLSTHTGPGFEGFTFLDLTQEMEKIVHHWLSIQLQFEGIYVGYLGSIDQIKFLEDQIPKLLTADGKLYVDPVMADHGRFYTGFDQAYADEMRGLCQMADYIIPNQTELSFLYGIDYRPGHQSADYFDQLVQRVQDFTPASLVLTGAGYDGQGLTGTFYYDAKTQDQGLALAPYYQGTYHGTGDSFGSLLVGALMNGAGLDEATSFATESVSKILHLSEEDVDLHTDGLNFEAYIGEINAYARCIKKRAKE